MAFPAWAAAAIQGGASLGGSIIGGIMTQKENKKARDWNEQMWYKQEELEQRKWEQENRYNEGLWNKQNEYNERVWHMMNQYNSPMSQMERFKEAGLNPALIYGQMSNTPSIAVGRQESARIGKGNLGNAVGTRFNFDHDTGLSTYLQFRESAARTNNLEAQNEVLKQEAVKKAAETVGIGTTNEAGKIQLGVLKETAMDAAEAALRKTNLESDLMLRRDEREAAMNASNLREAGERILNMRGQRMNQMLDAQLKQLDLELKQLGIQPTDNMIIRMLGRMLNEYRGNSNFDPTDQRW